jgi:hypothetical protein
VLARIIEAAGIATVSLSLVREHTEKVKPPRALYVPFPFGLAVGHPKDAAEQRRVLDAAFAMLDALSGPVLRDFPDDGRDEAGSPLQASEIAPGSATALGLADEVTAMRRYWETWEAREGRTSVGASRVNPQRFRGVVRFLEAIERGESDADTKERPPDIARHDFIRLAVSDLKVMYVEARLVTHPHESPNDRQRWLLGDTALGPFTRRLADVMNASPDQNMRDAAFGVAR